MCQLHSAGGGKPDPALPVFDVGCGEAASMNTFLNLLFWGIIAYLVIWFVVRPICVGFVRQLRRDEAEYRRRK